MMKIRVGIHDRYTDSTPENTYGVERIIIVFKFVLLKLRNSFINIKNLLKHYGFDIGTFKNDIALIRLDRDVKRSVKTNFICLSKNAKVVPGKLFRVVVRLNKNKVNF